MAVYDTYNSEGGWNVYGGTSVASPIIASVYALAGTPAAGSTPASYPYAHTSSLYDVTSGKTASCSPAYLCTAEVGYDGPTGLGTPNGTAAFSSGTSTGNTVTVTNPGSQSGKVGTAASLQISASVKANTTYTLSAYVDGAYVFIGTTGDGGTDVSAWTSTSSYGQLSVSFKTGASTTSMTIWVHGWYAQPTYYADDFSVM